MKIELQNISFQYKQMALPSVNGQFVLRDVNFSLAGHEIVGIVGASGSGKTTLIQMLNGLLVPDSGTVYVNGKPAVYKGESARHWRQEVAIVFQFPEMQFFEHTVYDEIAYALRNQNLGEEEIRRRVASITEQLGFSKEFLLRSPFQLSEGQKRRVAIASVLIIEPQILILDEPTAGLDFSAVRLLHRTIQNIYQNHRTVILVSHDMDFIAELATRIVAMGKGRLLFDGKKRDFFLRDQLLQESHLQPPRIMKMAKKFYEQGLIQEYPIFSLDELRRSLSLKEDTPS